MVRDQHFWKSQAQFLPETLKSFRLLLHPLPNNHYYMYCKCLLNCFIAMIQRDFMTHWYEVLDTLKSVNGKVKLRLMKMLKFKVTITQKLQIITFETKCSSLKITTPSIFFLQILKIQLYLTITIFLFLTEIIITFTFNSLLSVLIYFLEGKK